jgi:quercetin dioxygenase-like cupin family protein
MHADTQQLDPVISSTDDAEAPWFFGEVATILADGEHTAGRFAIVDQTAPQGMSPPWHVQPEDDETFDVIEGEITFWAGDPERGPAPRTLRHAAVDGSPAARRPMMAA